MAKRLFVGSLPYTTTSEQLTELFAQVGEVESVQVISDRYTGQSKGFAFVEMKTEELAKAAIDKFNGYALDGRSIVVNEAKPQADRSSGGGGGGFRGGNRSGGGGGFRDRRSGGRDRQDRW